MKGITSALALALLAGGGGHDQSEPGPVQTNIAFAPQPAFDPEERRAVPNPDCAPPLEGEYRTFGNRWGRYGDICINRVEVSFEAFPDPSVSYSIRSDRCPDLGRFGRFRRPENLFEVQVPEQIAVWKRALADDLREFGRQCGIRLDSAPFVDERFDRFYIDYGDGWWFDRLDDGFRLTPKVTADEPETGAY